VKTSKFINFFKNHSNLSVFLFILIFWFFLFITSASLFSGYHFTDDHEIVHINHNFINQKLSIIEVFSQWINTDYSTGRFRPFYYIHRILATKFLGIDFGWWSVYTGLLAVFTTFLLFVFGRLLEFSIKEALLFSFLTTLGTQSAVWWQLGPAETIGTFLLSATLVLAFQSEVSNSYKNIYNTSMLFCVLMMSLSKESFIIIIPAIAFIKLRVSRQFRFPSWTQAVRANKFSLCILGFIFCVELLFVKFYIGLAPDIGYAGIDEFSILRIVRVAKNLSQAGDWWVILASLISMILITMLHSSKLIFTSLKILYFPIILLLLVAVPQIFLYAKSGIAQRYLLPGILGYAFLTVTFYRYLNINYKFQSKLILLLILISLSLKLSLAWDAAHTFGLEGKSTTALLETVQANTEPEDPILIVTNPFIYSEWNSSIKKYLNYVSKRSNLYLSTYGSKTSKFYRNIVAFYNFNTLDKLKNKREISCIITFPEMKKIFLKNSSSWFFRNNFKEYEFGSFNRNLNKNSKIYLYCRKPLINPKL
jgi:hypothetical protein